MIGDLERVPSRRIEYRGEHLEPLNDVVSRTTESAGSRDSWEQKSLS
jgi:hypothetical protein